MKFAEIAQDPLTNRVIRSIQDRIWHGELMPGDYLPPQPQLAAQFGVGLSTVREAIGALSMIGLLEVRHGRGTRVLPDALKILNSPSSMMANLSHVVPEEVLEARLAIESALTRMAAERATPDDLAEMLAAYGQMQEAVENDDAFTHADVRFHLAVARASKNRVLAQTYYLIHSLLKDAIRQADALPGGKGRGLANHAQILEGIRTHNAELAQQGCERQITDVREFLRARVITN
jgi:GntR family transcriptional repressor for pyruvate dehydrogenase complex